MQPDEPERTRDAISAAKRVAFDSGVAWSLCGAAWGFFLIALTLGLFEELDHLALGDLKAVVMIAILAVAAWIWWLPMRKARRRMRDGGP